jgi:uncharacterized DUF497 family protein
VNFDWDANKERNNIKNHEGITFDFASKVFNDIWAIDEFDEQHSNVTEQRFTIVGLAENKLLRVTFTVITEENGEEVIRIISARKALGKDKESYEKARKELDI